MNPDPSTWTVTAGRIRGRWDHSKLRVQPFTDWGDLYQVGKQLCLVPKEGQRRILTIRAVQMKDKDWVCDFGIPTSEAADALIGATVTIHPSLRPPLAEGEFYLGDIFGMRVKTESGQDLGTVEEILESPAHNVYVTKRAMIPAHPHFIVSTDWDKRVLTVKDMVAEKPGE